MRVVDAAILASLLAFTCSAQPAAFEVVSIKPNISDARTGLRMRTLPGGHFSATGVPLRMLVAHAYNVPFNLSPRLTGLPDWANSARFDIEAKAPAGAFPPGMSSSEVRARMRIMLQALLADRFKLRMRRQASTQQAYVLTVASGGPKLSKPAVEEKDCAAPPGEGPGCHEFAGGQGRGLHARAVDMNDLAGYIENWTDLPVLDRTGLSGLYSMDTEGWVTMRPAPPPPDAGIANPNPRPSGDGDMSDPTRPTLFTVLRRLGLELKPQKAPVDLFVVESIDRPAAN